MNEPSNLKIFMVRYKWKPEGGSFGYFIHAAKTREQLERVGVLVDTLDEADLVLHITSPEYFTPVTDKRNLLFMAIEGSGPITWSPNVASADIVVVPCRANVEGVRRLYAGPVVVVPEGVDPERFPYHERKAPGVDEPFRFLFFGNAEGPRKGAEIVLRAWQLWEQTGRIPANVTLTIKCSGIPGGEERNLGPSVVLDHRKLTTDELRDLYNGSHAFLLPSGGEGWGLTLTEAMATGLPATFTHVDAMLDYGDDTVGYPITRFGRYRAWHANSRGERVGALESYLAEVDPSDLLNQMVEIHRDYEEALRRGRAASERMLGRYTWRQSAEKLAEVCRNLDRIVDEHEISRLGGMTAEGIEAERQRRLKAANSEAGRRMAGCVTMGEGFKFTEQPGAVEAVQAWYRSQAERVNAQCDAALAQVAQSAA